MAKLESQLRLSLLDQVTGPIRKISGALAGFQRQTAMVTAPFRGAVGQIAALGAGYLTITEGFSRTFTAAADAQAALTEIGIKADLSSSQLAQMQTRLTAMSGRVNQFTSDLTSGVDTMLTMGLSAQDAMGSIEAVGKAATATQSSITDLSSASVSAIQNMKVAPDQIAKMLDGMAAAGNAGAFEMRDMAGYFPQLTASAQSLGMTGVNSILDMAAALQIARRGAGDASTAANNMSNFLGKIMSPDVIKNFKKFGVDVTKELKKAHKQGVSPIEHFIKLVDEKTNGGQADLLGKLFGDKQVLDFVRPMISDFKDYLKIRGEAENASGTVAAAFARRMGDANQKIKAFQNSIINAGAAIGAHLLEPIGSLADRLTYTFDTMDSRFNVFDKLKFGLKGFIDGLGIKGGVDGGMSKIMDLLFGIQNGSAAADQAGQTFAAFRKWGEDVRSINDAVQASPVLKFLAELGATAAGMAFSGIFKIFAIAAGAKALIDAVREASSIGQFTENLKNLSALEWGGLTAGLLLIAERAKTVLGIFKKVQEVAPKAGSVSNAAATAGESAVQAGTRGKAMPGPWNPIGPVTKPEGWQAPKAPRVNATGPKISSVNVPSLPTVPAPPSTLGLAGFGVATSLGLGSARKMTPEQSDYFRSRMDGSSSNSNGVRIDADSISALTRKEGTQDVRVTNQQPPPNVTVNVNQNIVTSDPIAAGRQSAADAGAAVKASVEASYGGNPY